MKAIRGTTWRRNLGAMRMSTTNPARQGSTRVRPQVQSSHAPVLHGTAAEGLARAALPGVLFHEWIASERRDPGMAVSGGCPLDTPWGCEA